MDAKKDTPPTPEPPPEAVLISRALERLGLSRREAARRAGVSDTWWRYVTSGYQSVGGKSVEVRGPARTVARMAQVTGVTPAELRDAGRDDAADVLERLAAPPTAASHGEDPRIGALVTLLAELPPEAQNEVLRRMTRAAAAQDQGSPGQQRHVS